MNPSTSPKSLPSKYSLLKGLDKSSTKLPSYKPIYNPESVPICTNQDIYGST